MRIFKSKAIKLRYEIMDGNLGNVKKLLQKFKDINARFAVLTEGSDLGGKTLLHLAASEGHRDIASLLINYGADINFTDEMGRTPLHEAASRDKHFKKGGYPVNSDANADDDHMAVAELLISKGAKIDAKDKNGKTPLLKAVHHSLKTVVDLLISSGADMTGKDYEGWTPLHEAAAVRGRMGKNSELIDLLLSKGADVNAKTDNGTTPLHVAAGEGNYEISRLLILYGAYVNAKDIDDQTPLHRIAYSPIFQLDDYSREVAEFLIERGSPIDARDSYGSTPLHIAAFEGKLDCVKVFIANGADVNAVDKNGRTPLQLAKKNGNKSVTVLLKANGAKE